MLFYLKHSLLGFAAAAEASFFLLQKIKIFKFFFQSNLKLQILVSFFTILLHEKRRLEARQTKDFLN